MDFLQQLYLKVKSVARSVALMNRAQLENLAESRNLMTNGFTSCLSGEMRMRMRMSKQRKVYIGGEKTRARSLANRPANQVPALVEIGLQANAYRTARERGTRNFQRVTTDTDPEIRDIDIGHADINLKPRDQPLDAAVRRVLQRYSKSDIENPRLSGSLLSPDDKSFRPVELSRNGQTVFSTAASLEHKFLVVSWAEEAVNDLSPRMYACWKASLNDARFDRYPAKASEKLTLRDILFEKDKNLGHIIIAGVKARQSLLLLEDICTQFGITANAGYSEDHVLFSGPDGPNIVRKICRYEVENIVTGRTYSSDMQRDNLFALLGLPEINAVKLMTDTYQIGLGSAYISEIIAITTRSGHNGPISTADIVFRLKRPSDAIERGPDVGAPDSPGDESAMQLRFQSELYDHPVMEVLQRFKEDLAPYKPQPGPSYRRAEARSRGYSFEIYASTVERQLVLGDIEGSENRNPREANGLLPEILGFTWGRAAGRVRLEHIMFARHLSLEAEQFLKEHLGDSATKTFRAADPADSDEVFRQFLKIPKEGKLCESFSNVNTYSLMHGASYLDTIHLFKIEGENPGSFEQHILVHMSPPMEQTTFYDDDLYYYGSIRYNGPLQKITAGQNQDQDPKLPEAGPSKETNDVARQSQSHNDRDRDPQLPELEDDDGRRTQPAIQQPPNTGTQANQAAVPRRRLPLPVNPVNTVDQIIRMGAWLAAKSNMCFLLMDQLYAIRNWPTWNGGRLIDGSSYTVNPGGLPKRAAGIEAQYHLEDITTPDSADKAALRVQSSYKPILAALQSMQSKSGTDKASSPPNSDVGSVVDTPRLLRLLDVSPKVQKFSVFQVTSQHTIERDGKKEQIGAKSQIAYCGDPLGSHIFINGRPRPPKNVNIRGPESMNVLYRTLAHVKQDRRTKPVLVFINSDGLTPKTHMLLQAIRVTYRELLLEGSVLYLTNPFWEGTGEPADAESARLVRQHIYGFNSDRVLSRSILLRRVRLWLLLTGIQEIYDASPYIQYCNEINLNIDSIRQINAIAIHYEPKQIPNFNKPIMQTRVLVILTDVASSIKRWEGVTGSPEFHSYEKLAFKESQMSRAWIQGESTMLYQTVASQVFRLPQSLQPVSVKISHPVDAGRDRIAIPKSWKSRHHGDPSMSNYREVEVTPFREANLKITIWVSPTGDHLIIKSPLPASMPTSVKSNILFNAWKAFLASAGPDSWTSGRAGSRPQLRFITFQNVASDIARYLIDTFRSENAYMNGNILTLNLYSIMQNPAHWKAYRLKLTSFVTMAGTPEVEVVDNMLAIFGAQIAEITHTGTGFRIAAISYNLAKPGIGTEDLHVLVEPAFRSSQLGL
ncbi:hypothetical protein TWF696_002172 [Orbilia brochopaga]|uniref:Uncharacterized protein n=1 Tax=Orbilia brochopaga TaxID=3140254 RepID=A0AAV9U3Y7_9PEZI